MRCPPFLLPIVAMGVLLGTLPAAAQAQSMDKSAKPAMGAMKDTSAGKHDGAMGKDAMAKGGMAKDGVTKDAMAKGAMGKDAKPAKGMMDDKSKTQTKAGEKMKPTDAMMDKDAMAEPAKKSHP